MAWIFDRSRRHGATAVIRIGEVQFLYTDHISPPNQRKHRIEVVSDVNRSVGQPGTTVAANTTSPTDLVGPQPAFSSRRTSIILVFYMAKDE
jgi:hypothetical protein